MHRKYFYIVLGLTALCLLLILFFFIFRQLPTTKQPNSIPTVKAPFPTYITGVGIVEPQSGNINIGIPFNRIVKKVNVAVNDQVKKGDVLAELDNEDLMANLRVKQMEYKQAIANQQKLQELPRKEDLNIAQEALKKATLALNAAKTQNEMVANLPNPQAISKDERDRRLYKYQQAQSELREAQAQYDKVQAGSWRPDLKIAMLQTKQAKAALEAMQAEIEKTYIKSPIDGTILQIKIHAGETPPSDPFQSAITIGNTNELNLRVSFDQYNVANLPPNAAAVAYRQGDHTKEFPLTLIHVEPVMISKKYLTNAVNEKVDTQVFEILYRIGKTDSSLFIGEHMDVYLDKKK